MMRFLVVFLLIIMAMSVRPPLTAVSQDNDTWLPEEVQGYCEEIGQEYGICPELLMSIIEAESSGQADAANGGCRGLMQVSERWHYGRMNRLGVTDIFDKYGNILVGTDYLAELFGEYEEAATVLMVYHGERNAASKAERGEISEYATKILERSAELERLHGK